MIFFSYGTLRDAEYQRELFGRSVPTEPATLANWIAVFTESGYLTIVPHPGGTVDGALVAVNERELAICERWEDVPLYTHVDVRVTNARGEDVDTWAYVRAVMGGEPAPRGVLARADRADVIRAIRRLTNESAT